MHSIPRRFTKRPGLSLTTCGRLVLLGVISLMATAAQALAGDYAGSDSCRECHADEWDSWKTSHHYQAMQTASPEYVVGDFSDTEFEYGGVTSRFYTRDGKYYVKTDNAKGELQEFEIAYTFGFYPLQQYLIPFPDGRYQALNIVWDSRPEKEGGQRWVHLYPEDPVTHEDIVHWTGAFQNWNARCAMCHSTNLEKNYSAIDNRYKTTWSEINVACEACHGPASAHLEWAGGDRKAENRGFTFSLSDRGVFGPDANSASKTFSRQDGKRPVTQVETCAACHSRRSQFAHFTAGKPFDDQFRLSLITPGLYFPDGQINDEVYVHGSFLQSRMRAAGVVCSDCHDPHSNAVRLEDNGLCTQCHTAPAYDTPAHHRHASGGPGAACVNCHMPSKTYMVVDDRRDHSFRVPDPRLSLELGVPNACNQCHEEKSVQWAIESLDGWGVGGTAGAANARAMNSAWSGRLDGLPGLLSLAGQADSPAIMRASAIEAAQNFPSREVLEAVQQFLSSADPMLRAAAAQSMDWIPEAQRYAMLRDLISDDSAMVRMAVARQLAPIPADQLPGESSTELTALKKEYLETLKFNADMPEEQMNLGVFHAESGDPIAAEKAYRMALKLSPSFVPAMLNLADLYRANGLDQQAEPLLRRAVKTAPGDASARHALGLLMVRQGKLQDAIPWLHAAAEMDLSNARYRYVYAVALWETGDQKMAVAELESALVLHPDNRELISALGSYYQQLGEEDKLRALMQQ